MQCPKCFGEMECLSSDGEQALRIDRCLVCEGLYFDQLTRADLDLITAPDDIDKGDSELGAEYDQMVFVDCPKCHRMMDQRKIEDPCQIRFEMCTSCYSSFLDAGELRQFLSLEYRAEFKSLLPE